MKKNIRRILTGAGVSAHFGGLPKDLNIGQKYNLYWDFEQRGYAIQTDTQTYKAQAFEWDKPIPQ